MVEPALVSLTYACQRLGISRHYGHQLVARGEFPVTAVKVGKLVKVNREELDDFIGGRSSGEGQAAT